jgi:hypothetical protein
VQVGTKHLQTALLDVLDSLQIPVAIFITEGKILQGKDQKLALQILERWIAAPYTTIGNHSFSH